MKKRSFALRMSSVVAYASRTYPLYSGCGALANHRFMKLLAPETSEIAWAKSPGGRIQVPLNDHVGRAVFFFGDLDPKITWVLTKLVQPGATVLDVGANFGVITLLMAKLVGRSGSVHAFEPNPMVSRILEETVACNGIANVKVHSVALGSSSGEMPLHVPKGNLGAASFVQNIKGAERVLKVPTVKLDKVLETDDIRKVALIKLDVEGFELEVLKGARHLLDDLRPTILFESNERLEAGRATPVMQLLDECGYGLVAVPRCFVRMRTTIVDLSRLHEVRSHDFIAAPRGEVFSRMCNLLRSS